MNAKALIASPPIVASEAVICERCSATRATYADKCTADLGDACPGFLAIESSLASSKEPADGWVKVSPDNPLPDDMRPGDEIQATYGRGCIVATAYRRGGA